MSLINTIQDEIAKLLLVETVQVEIPPDPAMGDFAIPCFPFAKELRKSPVEIAKELAEKIPQTDVIAKSEAVGPYVNIHVHRSYLANIVVHDDLQFDKKAIKLLFEYVSPNTNKPLHLGHLRNMLLGSTCAKICAHAGYDVIRTCIYNDRGVSMSKSMLAYAKMAEQATPESMHMKPDHFAGHWYVKFRDLVEKHPELESEPQELLKKWEANDAQTVALWRKLRDWTITGYQQTYDRVNGIVFDKVFFESDIYTKGRDIAQDGFAKGLFERDEKGNMIAELGKFGQKVVLRADGTSVYITQDLYLAQLRAELWAPDAQIYVVGEEHKLHFDQLFAIQRLLGFPNADGLYHLSYGLISVPGGRMKSREGTTVDVDNLLDEMELLGKQAVASRHTDLDPSELDHRSQVIGHAALRYFILKYESRTPFTYDPEASLSFEGETGPYILYVVARINSILREAPPIDDVDLSVLNSTEAHSLLSVLLQTRSVIEEAAVKYKPHLIARHAMTVAQSFTSFYHAQQVLKAEPALRDARILLLQAVKRYLVLLLGLLDIDTLERM